MNKQHIIEELVRGITAIHIMNLEGKIKTQEEVIYTYMTGVEEGMRLAGVSENDIDEMSEQATIKINSKKYGQTKTKACN